FTGYDTLVNEAKVLGLSDGEELLDAVSTDDAEKDNVLVILDNTPFYAESGGQVADTGTLTGNGARLEVHNVQKTSKGYFVHTCTLLKGTVRTGDTLLAEVDADRRHSIMRNHTSAHLLQRALREVLGEHVHQAGSYVDEFRVRFDFTNFSAMSQEEIVQVEALVNRKIFEALPVSVRVLPIEEAKKMGALALFGEKYGDTVRVIDASGWSVEFCGGTHVSNTAHIGCFRILSESSVAAGVRRIEGTTGYGVLHLLDEREALLRQTATVLKEDNVANLPTRAESLMAEMREKDRELAHLQSEAAKQQADSLFQNSFDANGTPVYTALLPDADANALRTLCDRIRDAKPDAVGILCGQAGGKSSLAVCCGKQAVEKGLKAGEIVKRVASIAGGSGGGKPDFAMAGIKDSSKIEEALAAAPGIVAELVK
ncbi:MAG: DHHA1 domain-containing protein, partial [Oscillospiraceae bacterium]